MTMPHSITTHYLGIMPSWLVEDFDMLFAHLFHLRLVDRIPVSAGLGMAALNNVWLPTIQSVDTLSLILMLYSVTDCW